MASDEEVEADADVFQCETCPVADALADLEVDPENVAAWRLFRRVVSRFTVDTASAAVVLERVTAELDPEAFDDLIQRFTILYDTLHPPPAPSGE